jgi:hypothetical protein
MVESKKNLWLALAAAGTLIGAALLYHYATTSGEGDTETHTRDELVEELKKAGLDEVVKEKTGMIESRYFLKLLQFVGATTRERTASKRKQLTE